MRSPFSSLLPPSPPPLPQSNNRSMENTIVSAKIPVVVEPTASPQGSPRVGRKRYRMVGDSVDERMNINAVGGFFLYLHPSPHTLHADLFCAPLRNTPAWTPAADADHHAWAALRGGRGV